MKSIARKYVVGLMLLAALAAPVFTGIAMAQNPVPLINQPLVPDAAIPGGPGFTLTVNGTGFVSTSVVKWNGSVRTTAFVSQSQLKATILASDIATASTASVTVVSPGSGGGTSNAIFFDVSAPTFPIALNKTDYGTGSGSQPDSVGVGDFNGDGKLDLAVADLGSNTVTILLGNGDGTFQVGVDYATQSRPDSVIVGDFNGDGKLDLAVRNDYSNSVSILLGNGDGTFRSALNFSTGNLPYREIAGDFNADGKLDLAITNFNDNTVSILLGNGDGTFQAHRDYPAGPSPVGVATGDFNGDGKLDLAVVNFTGANTVSILLGNGDGTFQPPVPYGTGAAPVYVAVGDFNGDGKLDLAVANHSGNTVSILIGNGDGTFRPHVDYAVGAGPFMVATADMDADGRLDLAVANQSDGTVSILQGNGDGSFQVANSFPAGSMPSYVALADFNGDGRLDLAVAKLGDNAVAAMLQDGTVTLFPSNVNFGPQLLGFHSLPRGVTLTNTGTSTLNISGIVITGTDAGDFNEINNCGASLPPGGHCTIGVTFTPAQLGLRTAALTITDNAPGSPQSVPLSGFGVTSGPNATLSTTNLTFALQLVGTTSPAQPVTLSNYGTMLLNISSIIASGDFSQSNNCGSSLAPLASCTISVSFTPTQGGTRTGTLSIADNAPGSPQTVALSGTGTVVKLNPSSLSFHCHDQPNNCPPPPQTTTLTNVGTTTLTINSITINGQYFSETNNCPSMLGPNGFCTITVRFNPQSRGTFNGAVSVSANGGGSPQRVALSGTRTKRGMSLTQLSALSMVQTVAVPSPTGPSNVGTRVVEMVDPVRDDPFLGNGTKRQLLVRLWYPASIGDSCEPAPYTSPAVWNYFSERVGFPGPEVKTNSCLDAPVAHGAHPVVVFTPGYTGTFTDYTFIVEDLASRGYIVAAVDHTYEATAAEFPDGRFVKGVLGSHLDNTWKIDYEALSLALSVRSADLKFVLDELERLNARGDSPFAGSLDISRIGLMGHSLGGLATISGVQQEPRFRAAVLLDAELGDETFAGTDKAVLIVAAGRERWNESECTLWSNLRGPRFALNLKGAEHVTPSDAVWLAKGAVKTGSMGPGRTIEALRNYIAAFLDTNLRGKSFDPLLTGPASEYPDAEVTTQKQLLCGKVIEH